MKRILGSLVVLFSVMSLNTAAVLAEELQPALIVQAPENVFAPMGFDDNDNVQVVAYGNLSDTCHKAGPVYTRIDKDKKTIYVRNTVYYYSGCWCADVLIPYLQTINLGVLSRGDYTVVVENTDGSFQQMSALPIAMAKSASPDDYLYAPVDHLHFVKHQGAEASEFALSGIFRNTCMSLKDVKINYRPNHVIEVQPIAEMLTSGCKVDNRPFEATVKLKAGLSGRALIHVRSLNGQSLNQVIDL